MSFLQPWLLAALPLAALPIIIHLINQRRYQTVRWAAMMFLLAANKMSRGYARLRQYLIMAMRIAAIAFLIFVISRPLTGGWIGRAGGGRPDTTIVLMDRSPSMQQRGAGTGDSKLETGRRQVVQALKTIGSARWVAIEAGTNQPRELETIDALLSAPAAEPASASSDLPGMLLAAHEYIKANNAGRTEIWICSDLRENDWNAEDGRWATLREAFLELPQTVRFHLLAYPQAARDNLAVRVTGARRQGSGESSEVLVSLKITRSGGEANARATVPVRFEIGGARSEMNVEMAGPQVELKDHRLPLGQGADRGFGRVSIPADADPADNEFWFAFSTPSPRKTIVVADDPQAAQPLQLAAAIAPDPALACSAEVVTPDALGPVTWEEVSLLLWQSPLPEGDAADAIKAFLARGGQAVFFPPKIPGAGEFLGVKWGGWSDHPEDLPIEGWRGDQDVLANTLSGEALPVGKLQVRRSCGLEGEVTPLATLKGGTPLLALAVTNAGGAYFCATTPAPSDSSMATEGVVFYVMVQRAMARGAAILETTRQVVAAEATGDDPSRWRRLAGGEDATSTEYALHAGVYESGDRILAVNRSAAEDAAVVLADDRTGGLFRGLDYSRVDDRAGSLGSIIQEVWRVFLAAMMVAMLAEAALCLPKKPALAAAGAATS